MTDPEPARTIRRGRIKDARGRPVTMIDPVLMHCRRRGDILEAEPLGEIAREIGTG
jgi:hypothetical protein